MEQSRLLAFIRNLFSCEIDSLPTNTLKTRPFSFDKMSWLSDYKDCLYQYTDKATRLQDCSRHIADHCPKHAQTAMNRLCDVHINMVNSDDPIKYINYYNNSEEKIKDFQIYKKCLRGVRESLESCTSIMKSSCQKTRIRSAKVLRMDMSSVEELLKQDHEIKVIYLIRDPRGIILSTMNTLLMAKNSLGSINNEAYGLCKKMESDYKTYKDLIRLYPERIRLVRYEDISENLVIASHLLYEFIGVIPSIEVDQHLNSISSSKENGGNYSQERQNSSETASAWRHKLSQDHREMVESVCEKVLQLGNYS